LAPQNIGYLHRGPLAPARRLDDTSGQRPRWGEGLWRKSLRMEAIRVDGSSKHCILNYCL